MKQCAILLKSKNLEIILTSNGKMENGYFIGGISASPSQKVLGYIFFESDRHHNDILKKFGEKYPGHNGVYRQGQKNLWSSVAYHLNFEPVIIPAFVNYFSQNKL